MSARFDPRRVALALASWIVLAFAVAMPFVHAAERVWKIERFSGDVTVTDSAGKAYAIGPGFLVHPGDRIMTGANGRVMISRGADSIVMSLNALIEIPPTERQARPRPWCNGREARISRWRSSRFRTSSSRRRISERS